MILETQFKRFKRECLQGRSQAEVRAAKDMFYAGAAAMLHSALDGKNADRRLAALFKEMERFQRLTAVRAKK
jgi:hypothetical protein